MTDDRRNFGSRLLAFLALWLMLSGLVMALSFVNVVLVANAMLLIAGTAAAAVWGLRRIEFERKLATAILVSAHGARLVSARVRRLGIRPHATRLGAATWKVAMGAGFFAGHAGHHLWRRLRAMGGQGRKASSAAGLLAGRTSQQAWRRARSVNVRPHVARAGVRARQGAAGMPTRAGVLLDRGVRAYALAAYRLQLAAARAFNAGAGYATSMPRRNGQAPDESVQARRLNALGTQLRRQGEHEQAAVQYRVALEIVRDLGDEQAEAMTLNNLALALAQAGAEEEAVEHLEHAREVLHELGDEEHEGQVIANLGIVYRRQGNSDEAETLLQEALHKLPPESPVYRQVERELLHAS